MSFSDDFDNGWPKQEELEAAMRDMETLDRAFSLAGVRVGTE